MKNATRSGVSLIAALLLSAAVCAEPAPASKPARPATAVAIKTALDQLRSVEALGLAFDTDPLGVRAVDSRASAVKVVLAAEGAVTGDAIPEKNYSNCVSTGKTEGAERAKVVCRNAEKANPNPAPSRNNQPTGGSVENKGRGGAAPGGKREGGGRY
jgi:hypothetical protein